MQCACFVDQHNIEIVREWLPNEISSTGIRFTFVDLFDMCIILFTTVCVVVTGV